jgi:hypothetical protein
MLRGIAFGRDARRRSRIRRRSLSLALEQLQLPPKDAERKTQEQHLAAFALRVRHLIMLAANRRRVERKPFVAARANPPLCRSRSNAFRSIRKWSSSFVQPPMRDGSVSAADILIGERLRHRIGPASRNDEHAGAQVRHDVVGVPPDVGIDSTSFTVK